MQAPTGVAFGKPSWLAGDDLAGAAMEILPRPWGAQRSRLSHRQQSFLSSDLVVNDALEEHSSPHAWTWWSGDSLE